MIRSLTLVLVSLVVVIFAVLGCQQQGGDGEYQIALTDRGFEPAEIKIPSNQAVTLVVTRKTDQTCAKELVFADTKQRHELPLNQPVRIALPPQQGGTLSYACAMDMISGKIVVR